MPQAFSAANKKPPRWEVPAALVPRCVVRPEGGAPQRITRGVTLHTGTQTHTVPCILPPLSSAPVPRPYLPPGGGAGARLYEVVTAEPGQLFSIEILRAPEGVGNGPGAQWAPVFDTQGESCGGPGSLPGVCSEAGRVSVLLSLCLADPRG